MTLHKTLPVFVRPSAGRFLGAEKDFSRSFKLVGLYAVGFRLEFKGFSYDIL